MSQMIACFKAVSSFFRSYGFAWVGMRTSVKCFSLLAKGIGVSIAERCGKNSHFKMEVFVQTEQGVVVLID